MNRDFLYGIIFVIIVGLAIFFILKSRNDYSIEISDLEERLKNVQVELVDKDQRIYQSERIIVSKDRKIRELLDSVQYLRSVKSVVVVQTVTKVDTLKIPFKEIIIAEIDSSKYLRIPTSFEYTEPWFSIHGRIDTLLIFDSIQFYNDFYIATGYKDYGSRLKNLFNKPVPLIQIRDNNPYTSIKSMRSVELQDLKPKRFGIGFSGGYAVTNNGLSPYLGVGLNYNLIYF